MHGAGNDFIVVDNRANYPIRWELIAPKVCDRHMGVGADGILLIEEGGLGDFRMRLFNADGSEAEMCGNGIRCVTKYVIELGLTNKSTIVWDTLSGLRTTLAFFDDFGKVALVKVNMGKPIWDKKAIPVAEDVEDPLDVAVNVDGVDLRLHCVGMGNPHAVAFVESVDEFPLEKVGRKIQENTIFPRSVNFEIVEIQSDNVVKARVFERGVGETLACGSGASAIGVMARRIKHLKSPVSIKLRGGELQVEWDGNSDIFMTGPAEFVFKGVVDLDV